MAHKDHYRNGVKLVSVTELQKIISKPFLDTWRESLCQKGLVCGFDAAKAVAEEASELGNRVHEDVAACITSGYSYVPQTEWGAKINLKLQEMGVKKYLMAPEATILDVESNLAGSPDFVGQSSFYSADEGLEVITSFIGDIKIKNTLDILTGMQGAGYRYLIKRRYKEDINKMLIMWGQKKTVGQKVKPIWIDLNEWTMPFQALVTVWNTLNPKRRVTLFND